MSSTDLPQKSDPFWSKAAIARRKRLKSKASYRTRHAERLREELRIRMQQRRARAKNSEEEVEVMREQRREADAEYRENQRRKKFTEKHGIDKYHQCYVPLLNEYNSFRLAGVKLPTEGQKARKSKGKE
ncbi:hypothetical protein C8R46DRAFT_1214646 [Mycena filopes]|nr:hypothetical protein C8R46DRAFT_1214646 [Mycena filopes]